MKCKKLARPATVKLSYPHIRWMIRRDIEEVLEIEQLCFATPWLEKEFIRCLRQRNCIGRVIEDGRDVLGFMVYELYKNRIELLNIAVHPCCWRRGLGRAMIEKLIEKLTPQRRREIRTIVGEEDLDAQLFFRSIGFRAIAVVPHEFVDRDLKGVTGYAFRFEVER